MFWTSIASWFAKCFAHAPRQGTGLTALFPCWSFHCATWGLPGSVWPAPLVNRRSITFLLLQLCPRAHNQISLRAVVVSSVCDPNSQFAMLSVMKFSGNCKWAVLSAPRMQ